MKAWTALSSAAILSRQAPTYSSADNSPPAMHWDASVAVSVANSRSAMFSPRKFAADFARFGRSVRHRLRGAWGMTRRSGLAACARQFIDELGILGKVGRLAGINHFAVVEDVGAIGDRQRQRRILLDQKHRQ